MRLEPRPWEEDKGKDDAATATSLRFRVLLSRSCLGNGIDATWRWREIEIRPVGASEYPTVDAQTTSIATLSLSSQCVRAL